MVNVQLTFTPSVMRVCFNVTTVGDDILEGDETLNLGLDTADENVILDPEMAVVTIVDNDREFKEKVVY